MKIILALLIFASGSAFANALASIYNGQQFNLKGYTVVQDADIPTDFYIMPQIYRVKRGGRMDPETGQIKKVYGVQHRLQEIGGHTYSVYTVRVDLVTPGQIELLMATGELQRLAGPNARIRGLAPICGIDLGLPAAKPMQNPEGVRPDATVVRYALRSTEAGKCESIITNTSFNLEISAPIEMEPQIAQDITSEEGLVLPSIELVLPYKYKDSVKLTIDARHVFQQMKASGELVGSFKAVSAGVSANMTKMFNLLQISGKLSMDCQNQTACDRFYEQAKEILSKTIIKYTEVAVKDADTKSLIVGDKEKVTPKMVRAELAMDQAGFENVGNFVIDFSNMNYAVVRTQATLDISRIGREVLDEKIRSMLERAK